jgi:hypothetical protein
LSGIRSGLHSCWSEDKDIQDIHDHLAADQNAACQRPNRSSNPPPADCHTGSLLGSTTRMVFAVRVTNDRPFCLIPRASDLNSLPHLEL